MASRKAPFLALLAFSSLVGIAGCDDDGAMENAGEEMDDAAEEAGDEAEDATN